MDADASVGANEVAMAIARNDMSHDNARVKHGPELVVNDWFDIF